MSDQQKEIDRLKRKLANARKRAVYASGRPDFSGRGVVGNSGHADDLYELAMCDIDSLTRILEAKTGKKFKRSDPKGDFRKSFQALLNASTKPAPPTGGARK